MNFTRRDILEMPIFERKVYIQKLVEGFEKQAEATDKARNKAGR